MTLRSIGLGRSLGGFDENHYILYFGFSSLGEIVTTYFNASNHIFHTILMRLMMLSFGDENEIAIRFPSFVAGMACLWLIYKLAYKLFNSFFVAWLSLFIAAICPVHILYSQTARGYGLIMFFSAAMLLAVLQLLQTQRYFKWGSVAAVCGFLSIYTVPTNVYFVFALAGWVFVLLVNPRWRKEFAFVAESLKKNIQVLVHLFLAVVLLSCVVYFPILDQMAEVFEYDKNHAAGIYGLQNDPLKGLFFGVMPDAMNLIFKGPLQWFLPFLLVGIIRGDVLRGSYRWLPVFIFFLPMGVILLSGVAGYPRNFLFNFPLLVIFLAAGMVKAGQILGKFILTPNRGKMIGIGILAVYASVSTKILILEHYPSIKTADQRLYKKMLRKNTKPHDLIAIENTGSYLYARSTYKENIKNILFQNKLDGVKLIAPHNFNLDNFNIYSEKKNWAIFKKQMNREALKIQSLPGNKDLISLSGSQSISILPDDFTSETHWKIVTGPNRFSPNSEHKIIGDQSLWIQAPKEQNLIIRTELPPLTIKNDSLIVLVWAEKRSKKYLPAYHPSLSFKLKVVDQLQDVQIPMGKINEGMHLLIPENPGNLISHDWSINAAMGKFPSGNYTFSMWLKVEADQTVYYDDIRLFFIDAPIEFKESFDVP